MMSLLRWTVYAKENNIDLVMFPITFDSLINRARNAAVAHFLSDPDATHILFIDADISFSPEDVIKLIQTNQPVVGAGYPQKWLDMSQFNPNAPKPLELCTRSSVHLLDKQPISQIMQASYITTGFLLIKREVFTKLIQHFPDKQYVNDIDGYRSASSSLFYDFFSISINPNSKRLESEDYGFSRMWTMIGGHIYVVTDIVLTHHGWFGYNCNLNRQLTMNI
jgi:hypothetical protein